MGKNVVVESRGMMQKFARLESSLRDEVKVVIKESTQEAVAYAKELASKPVTVNRRGKKIRSRPGQPARSETGRLKRSITGRMSPKGWVGTITTTDESTDKNGNRYPWMLERGTRTVKKRPLFVKVKKLIKKKFRPRVGRAMVDAVRKANRS